MKCKFCGAEMPDEANFCGKCARPLKDNISENIADRAQNMNPSSPQTVRQGNDERHKNNLGLFSMIIGLISLIFSCMGFFGYHWYSFRKPVYRKTRGQKRNSNYRNCLLGNCLSCVLVCDNGRT